MVVRDGRSARAAVPRHPAPGRRPAASRACCRSRSRPTTRRAGASTSTSPPRGDQRIVEYRRASADRADPARARLVLAMADPESNHNGGLLRSAPTGCSTSAWATAAAAATGTAARATPRTSARCSARSSASTRARAAAAVPDPALEPVRRPRGRARRDLRLRAAQPVALLVRPPHRRPGDRRRRPGRGRGDRLRAQRPRRGANFGWRPFEGAAATRPASPRPAPCRPVIQRSHEDGFCSITGGYVVRDRALPRSTAATSTATSASAGSRRRGCARAGDGDAGRTRLRVADQLSSFGEDARGRVYVVSLDGPVYRIAARR